ncbi:MAG: ABC transporter permease subunit [Actinomycetota bacterium]
MAWVTWRQHRSQLVAGLGVLAAIAVAALVTALPVRDAYHHQALSSCLPPAARPGCDLLVNHFRSEFGSLAQVGRWLILLPGLALLVGAPLLARELEHGTFLLAWTQGVSRRRWLLAKTALLGAGVVVLAALAGLLAIWWRSPFDHVEGRMAPMAFDVEGVVVPAYTLYALALGVLAGVVLRRTLAALALAAAGFVLTRLGVEKLLRPYYLSPLHQVATGATPGTHARDWVFDDKLVDSVGRRITSAREDLAVVHAQHAGIDAQQYLVSLGWRRVITFQPAGRFWEFQGIETAIFLLLALGAIAFAARLLRRRPS